MRRFYFALIGLAVAAACGQKKPDQSAISIDTASRDIKLTTPDSTVALNDAPSIAPNKVDTVYLPQATPPKSTTPKPRQNSPSTYRPSPRTASPPPAPTAVPAPLPAVPVSHTLAAGTVVETRSTRALTSRTNKPGETFTATVDEAVTTPSGRVVIPAGSEVTLTIDSLKPAESKSDKDGTIIFRATSVLVNGQSMPIDADVTYVEHTLKGRGVGAGEVGKVGVGVVAGAIIGKVIGGGTGAAAGGVVGGAAGAVVAAHTADRDVVIPVGAKIRLALRSDFTAN